MKKIYVVVEKKEVEPTLKALQDMGSVHVEHQEELTGYQLSQRREEVQMLTSSIEILEGYQKKSSPELDLDEKVRGKEDDWTEISNRVLKRSSDIAHLKERISKRQSVIDYWEDWGDFSPEDIKFLAQEGIYLQLFECRTSEKEKLSKTALLETISVMGVFEKIVSFSEERIESSFEISPPEFGLAAMKTMQEDDQHLIQDAEMSIEKELKGLSYLRETLIERSNVLALEEVEQGMKEEEALVLLKGFIPGGEVKALQAEAKKEKWGLLVEEPSDEDAIPTLLKNPRWVDLIQPVFKFVDILPGYKEVDVSTVFLIFFSIFFGMLIGDAAYGIIFLILNLFFHRKLGKKLKDKAIFHLMYLLSTVTIIWGLLTGTFFGQAWLVSRVEPIVPWLTEMNNIILLCFVIAAVHLSIARIWQAVLLFPSLRFLSQIGWLLMVWAMFFAANLFVLNVPFSEISGWMSLTGITSAVLIVFFTKPNKNPLKAIGPGLLELLGNFINAFTDVVSYIRLFAVGLATVAVADAFNEMAMGVGFKNIFVGFGASLILIVGHVLNMILAGLAVLVHGIRLNVLEFPGHLNLEWGGFSYKPFKKVKR